MNEEQGVEIGDSSKPLASESRRLLPIGPALLFVLLAVFLSIAVLFVYLSRSPMKTSDTGSGLRVSEVNLAPQTPPQATADQNATNIPSKGVSSDESILGLWKPKEPTSQPIVVSQFVIENGKRIYRETSEGKTNCEGTWNWDETKESLMTECVSRVAGYEDFTITLQAKLDPNKQELTFIDEGQASVFVRTK